MEELDYNPLFRWFVALNRTDRTTFGKNRDRLPAGEVAATFFDAMSCRAVRRVCPPKSTSPATGTLWEPVRVSAMDTHQSTNNAASDRLDALATRGGPSYRCPRVTDRVPSDEEPLR